MRSKTTTFILFSTIIIAISIGLGIGVSALQSKPAHAQQQLFAAGLKPPQPVKCDSPETCQYNGDLKNNPIILWIAFFINVLAAVIGVGAVAMLIFAGVQYTAAADNPSQVEAAKKKIGAVVLGLVAFIFLYAFLNWLIPGGVIG